MKNCQKERLPCVKGAVAKRLRDSLVEGFMLMTTLLPRSASPPLTQGRLFMWFYVYEIASFLMKRCCPRPHCRNRVLLLSSLMPELACKELIGMVNRLTQNAILFIIFRDFLNFINKMLSEYRVCPCCLFRRFAF